MAASKRVSQMKKKVSFYFVLIVFIQLYFFFKKNVTFHYENPVDSEIEFDQSTSKKKSKNKTKIDQTTRFLTRWPGDVSNTLQRSKTRQRSTPNRL